MKCTFRCHPVECTCHLALTVTAMGLSSLPTHTYIKSYQWQVGILSDLYYEAESHLNEWIFLAFFPLLERTIGAGPQADLQGGAWKTTSGQLQVRQRQTVKEFCLQMPPLNVTKHQVLMYSLGSWKALLLLSFFDIKCSVSNIFTWDKWKLEFVSWWWCLTASTPLLALVWNAISCYCKLEWCDSFEYEGSNTGSTDSKMLPNFLMLEV